MEIQLVSFEQAKALKELGFPQRFISSFGWFSKNGLLNNSSIDAPMEEVDDECVAPSYEFVAKWLREDCDIYIEVDRLEKLYSWKIISSNNTLYNNLVSEKYNTYEEALSAGIDRTIEMLKEYEHKRCNKKLKRTTNG